MEFIKSIILPYKYNLDYLKTNKIINGKQYEVIILEHSLTYAKYYL